MCVSEGAAEASIIVNDRFMEPITHSTSNTDGQMPHAKPPPSRPLLTVPPRNPSEALQKSSDVTPSPMTLVSSFFADQEPSSPQFIAGDMTSLTAADAPPKSNAVPINHSSGSGSFAERLAARGLGQKDPPGALRSSTARFKSMTPSRLPIPRSPYLTIPPGLSPTTLLDSPVLLSTGQAEPSPTTGTFPLPPISQAGASNSFIDVSSDQDGSPTFVFKHLPKMGNNPIYPLAKFVSLTLNVFLFL